MGHPGKLNGDVGSFSVLSFFQVFGAGTNFFNSPLETLYPFLFIILVGKKFHGLLLGPSYHDSHYFTGQGTKGWLLPIAKYISCNYEFKN